MPKTLPRNGELADQLDLLADLSEILEEASFKVIAYRRAAGRIRTGRARVQSTRIRYSQASPPREAHCVSRHSR